MTYDGTGGGDQVRETGRSGRSTWARSIVARCDSFRGFGLRLRFCVRHVNEATVRIAGVLLVDVDGRLLLPALHIGLLEQAAEGNPDA